MSINGEWFDNLSVIKAINEKDDSDHHQFHYLDRNVSLMKEKLDKAQWYMPIAYTPHDFTHHVRTVMNYGSQLISPYLDQFSIDDLLVFEYAILLHDIDMIYNPFGREKHSLTADEILAPFESESNVNSLKYLAEKVNQDIFDMKDIGTADISDEQKEMIIEIHNKLTDVMEFIIPDISYRKAIGSIILGHSNIKLGEHGQIPTLDGSLYRNAPEGTISFKQIKTRILAAILRIADELDCSERRKSGIDTPVLPEEGRPYWERLDLFSSVRIDLPRIELLVNETYITKKDDKELHFRRMKEVVEKICQEINTANICFKEEKTTIHFNKVEIVFTDKEVEEAYNQYSETQKKNPMTYSSFDVDGLIYRIRQKIEEKELLSEVHLERGGRGIRNDLDCNGLLTNAEMRDEIVWAMINHIFKGDFGISPNPREMEDNSYLLVGVANSGVLIASHIAFITGLPMLYYVPTEKHPLYTKHEIQWEKNIELLKNRKVILIIGTSVTGYAIRDAKKHIGKLFQLGDNVHIEAVLGIVNRDNDNVIMNELRTQGTVVDFLIEGYPADWCNHSNDGGCPYDYKCRGHAE